MAKEEKKAKVEVPQSTMRVVLEKFEDGHYEARIVRGTVTLMEYHKLTRYLLSTVRAADGKRRAVHRRERTERKRKEVENA